MVKINLKDTSTKAFFLVNGVVEVEEVSEVKVVGKNNDKGEMIVTISYSFPKAGTIIDEGNNICWTANALTNKIFNKQKPVVIQAPDEEPVAIIEYPLAIVEKPVIKEDKKLKS